MPLYNIIVIIILYRNIFLRNRYSGRFYPFQSRSDVCRNALGQERVRHVVVVFVVSGGPLHGLKLLFRKGSGTSSLFSLDR